MQFLTNEEAEAWAVRRGYRVLPPSGRGVPGEIGEPVRFIIPADAGSRVTLARTLWEASGEGAPEALVWVTDHGIWPSGEHVPLAEATRRGLGAERSLTESPGHLVRLGESDEGLSVLCLAVLFLWDCWVLPADRRPSVFVSHDEFGVVDQRGADGGLRSRLAVLGLLRDPPPG